MALCNSHPHAQVPVTNGHIALSYCWQCQAFSVSMWRDTQFDDTELVEDLYGVEYLGPFDGVDSVLEVASRYLIELVNGSGLPWDRSSWD